MSYATVEAGILAVIIKHADFSASNVKQADFRDLGKGLARCVVLTFGGTSKESLTIQYEKHIWTTNVDIFVPWKGEAYELEQRITTESQKIQDAFGLYPRLDAVSGILKSEMSSGAMPGLLSLQKTRYRGKRYLVVTEEEVNPGRLE